MHLYWIVHWAIFGIDKTKIYKKKWINYQTNHLYCTESVETIDECYKSINDKKKWFTLIIRKNVEYIKMKIYEDNLIDYKNYPLLFKSSESWYVFFLFLRASLDMKPISEPIATAIHIFTVTLSNTVVYRPKQHVEEPYLPVILGTAILRSIIHEYT
jgi:hypothetical protein